MADKSENRKEEPFVMVCATLFVSILVLTMRRITVSLDGGSGYTCAVSPQPMKKPPGCFSSDRITCSLPDSNHIQ